MATAIATARAWVIVRTFVDHAGTKHEHSWHEYWTGKQGDKGGPSRSPFRSDAFHFTTSGAAYECAATHWQLKDSDDWRVVPADPRLRKR